MKRSLILAMVLTAGPAIAQSPAEKAQKRLEDLVTIGRAEAAEPPARPLVWRRAGLVEAIEFSAAPISPKLIHLPAPARKLVFPPAMRESTPLTAFRDPSSAPSVLVFPTQPLVHLPAVNASMPIPVPILSQPVPDRASLGDPAFDISVESAMKAFAVVRDRPISFVPINIPDPFENVRYGQLRNPPDENATPVVVPFAKPQ